VTQHPKAVGKIAALDACLGDRCAAECGVSAAHCGGLVADAPACQPCVDVDCCAQAKECGEDGECAQVINCRSACAAGDTKCQDACVTAAPSASATLFEAYDACFAGCKAKTCP
jgi:hypothetical protein